MKKYVYVMPATIRRVPQIRIRVCIGFRLIIQE
jgi:hypothetical protein